MKGQPYRASAKEPAERLRGYVYVIRNIVGLFKIGHTNNMKKRMQDHRHQYFDQPLEVVIVRQADNRYKAETKLHRLFASQRVHREWFDLTPADLDTIRDIQFDGEQ